MSARVQIDPNVRVRGNGTYVGFEDLHGVITQGQEVAVYEQESGLNGRGRVTEIDIVRRLVYLAIDWPSLRYEDDSAQDAKTDDVLHSAGQVLASLADRREANSIRSMFGASKHLPGGAYWLNVPHVYSSDGPVRHRDVAVNALTSNVTKGKGLVA
jgi:hypothetical protein